MGMTHRVGPANRADPADRDLTRRSLLTGALAATVVAAGGSVLAACGSSGGDDAGTNPALQPTDGSVPESEAAIGMSPASFDNAADRPSPVMVGISDVNGEVLAWGTIDLAITPTGSADATPAWTGPATFLPLVGRPEASNSSAAPVFGPPSAGVGVYRTEAVRLPAGFYEITATGTTDRGPLEVRTGLEVLERSRVLVAGAKAPATRNPVIATAGVPASEIDSRATTTADLDPRIHTVVIADALAARRPVVVAVTTPVYCQSKFCGPITDVVAGLADRFPRAALVHLEVWKDYETTTISPFAAEWIWPDGDQQRGANEPWVFLVGRDGTITQRWGNVLDLGELTALLEQDLARP